MIPNYKFVKLEIFIPESHLEELRLVIATISAMYAPMGKYDNCLSYSKVTSTWRPLPGANPYKGTINEISKEEELKVETTIYAAALEGAIKCIKHIHPYEEPVINVIPLLNK